MRDAHELAHASWACDASGRPQAGHLHAPRSVLQTPERCAPPARSRHALACLNAYTACTMENCSWNMSAVPEENTQCVQCQSAAQTQTFKQASAPVDNNSGHCQESLSASVNLVIQATTVAQVQSTL